MNASIHRVVAQCLRHTTFYDHNIGMYYVFQNSKFQPQIASMEGYPAIAKLMGHHDEFAIVRRFRELNMQDILYLQAEIIHLKEELETLEYHDKEDPERSFFSRDWWSLAHAEDEESSEQWSKVLEIRNKLEQYSTSLIMHDENSALINFVRYQNYPTSCSIQLERSKLLRSQVLSRLASETKYGQLSAAWSRQTGLGS